MNLIETKLPYGKFNFGKDKVSSWEIFGMLKGKNQHGDARAIQMKHSQEILGLYVSTGIIYCNLDELKENVANISREIFRIAKLEDGNILPLNVR